ncbi:MAG TPA: hypothetical protein VED46_18290 [Alphaproteobacteria bacterium]|nr:hypothetical protein [Alphaproteobacteria bacterium]
MNAITLTRVRIAFLSPLVFVAGIICAAAQVPPKADNSRHSLLREAMLGLVSAASIPDGSADEHCIALPLRPASDRIHGPHGDVLLETRCEVVEYKALGSVQGAAWSTARYEWTLVFTAEDTARGAGARDIVTEEEVVLFEAPTPGRVHPVWHKRFETGDHAFWRSVMPEIAPADQGTVLLSLMTCLNGTGGCGQEFLQRRPEQGWLPVAQDWLDQLPPGFSTRIRHGVRIDPRTLRGEAGFYGDHDPNCCPSQRLLLRLALRGNALNLVDHALVPSQQ